MTRPRLDLQAERFTATGNITSEGMRNQLGRPRLDRLAVLIRESAQNAWDAQAPDSSTVVFGVACYELSPENLECLAQRILPELPHPSSVPEDIPSLATIIEEARRRVSEGSTSGLRGLVLYDRGTTGLGGPTRADVHDDGDESRDFIDFFRNIGQPPDKSRGGGTFGYGKAALYLSSAVSTILVHTRCLRLGLVESRFMASCLTSHYQTSEARFTGRHWWGRWDDDHRVVDPVVGDEASEIATELGIPDCLGDSLGTTILLLAPDFGDRTPKQAMAYMVSQMLWNFWPKMVPWEGRDAPAMRFEASLDGRPMAIPRLESTPPIEAFVQSLHEVRATDAGEPTSGSNRASALECHRPRRRLGLLSLCRMIRKPRVDMDFGEDAILPPFAERCHHVALLRRAELVVAYYEGPVLPNDHLEYAGVFLADDSLDRTYAASEPPTHDEWRSENLADVRARRLVGSTFRRLDEAMQRFVKPAATGFQTSIDRPLAAIASHLGSLLVGTEGPRGVDAWATEPRSTTAEANDVVSPVSEGAGSEADGDGPGPRNGGRRSTKRPRVELMDDVELRARDDEVLRVFRFQLRGALGGARLQARVYPILSGGVRENEPPAGSDQPVIESWRDPGGGEMGSGEAIEITAAMEGTYSIWVKGATDALIGLELTADGIFHESV